MSIRRLDVSASPSIEVRNGRSVSDESRVSRLSLTKTLLVFLLALAIAAPAASGTALGVYTGAANPSGVAS
jgi:hypothetical protein